MSGCRGRPKTTGRSHNKRSNTYSSTRTYRENPPKRSSSVSSNLMTAFFKPVKPTSNKFSETLNSAVVETNQEESSPDNTENEMDFTEMDDSTKVTRKVVKIIVEIIVEGQTC